jgi:hypothetical protein
MVMAKIEELRALTGAALKAELGKLSKDELQTLRAAEAADKDGSKTLIKAIDRELKSLGVGDADADTPDASAPPTPEHLREDYTGPLTIEQATQRHRAFGHHVTKPAKVQATKEAPPK